MKKFIVFSVCMGFYFFIIALFVVIKMNEAESDFARKQAFSVPSSTYEERVTEYNSIKTSLDALDDDPVLYFQLLARTRFLERQAARAEYEGYVPKRDTLNVHFAAGRLFNDFPINHPNLRLKHSKEFELAYANYRLGMESISPADDFSLFWLLVWAYFAGMLPIPWFYKLRFEMSGCYFWTEFLTWRMYVFIVLYPLGLFLYKDLNPKEQLVSACRTVMGSLTFFLSVFCCGAKALAQEKGDDDTKPKASSSQPIGIQFSSSLLSKDMILNGVVIHPGVVEQNNLKVFFPKGFFVEGFASVALGNRDKKPNFGNELDFAVGWIAQLKGYKIVSRLNYADVASVKKLGTGDVMEAAVTVSRKVKVTPSQSLEPFGKYRYVFPVRGSKPNAGWFVHAGVVHTWLLKQKLSVSTDASFIYDSGATGQKRGLLFRMVNALVFKLDNHISLQLPIIQTSLPIYVRDLRRQQIVLGLGISYTR